MAVKSHPIHIYVRHLGRVGLDTRCSRAPLTKANPASHRAAGLLLLVGFLHAYNDPVLLTWRRAQPPPRTIPASRNRHSRLHFQHCKNPTPYSTCCRPRLLTTRTNGDKTPSPLPAPYRRSPIPTPRRAQRRRRTSPAASDRHSRLQSRHCRNPIRSSICWVRSLPPPPRLCLCQQSQHDAGGEQNDANEPTRCLLQIHINCLLKIDLD